MEKTLEEANVALTASNELLAKANAIKALVDTDAFTTESIVIAVSSGDLSLLATE